jgi:hypothetical protein
MARTGLKELRNPVVVAAFGGWNDAGEAASGVIDHLADAYEARLEFALDPEEYYDFQVNRPTARMRKPTERVIGGPEPNYHWRDYTARLMSLLRTVRPELVVLLGALLTDTPHSRPVPVSATASNPRVAEELGLDLSTYEGPTGILGVLAAECDQLGLTVVSLWASVPHYVAEPPNPKAALALLTRLEDVLNTPLETGELPEDAENWETQVNELVSDDPDIANYIAALEERRDEETPAATGDTIAAEFERYLRRRNRPGQR